MDSSLAPAKDESNDNLIVSNEPEAEVLGHLIDNADVWRSDDIDLIDDTFEVLNLSDELLRGLKKAGFVRPSRLQSQAIPLGRIGQDLVIQSKSGTGKTLIFGLIALDSLDLQSRACQALILAPTREIAFQIANVIKTVGAHLVGLSVQTFIGGLHVHLDHKNLLNCHIAVGTLGRIKQLIESQALDTQSLRLLVLDEADMLLERNFRSDLELILKQMPSSRQTLAVSATFSDDLRWFTERYMDEPTTVKAKSTCVALLGIQLCKLFTFQDLRYDFEFRSEQVVRILDAISFTQALVFSNFQTRAEHLYDRLTRNGYQCAMISSKLHQKERLKVLRQILKLQLNVIICTDLLARGVDCEHVNLVLNMDVPNNADTFLHRVGRAGRFGRNGLAVTFVSEGASTLAMTDIEQTLDLDIQAVADVTALDQIWNRHCCVFNDSAFTFQDLQDELKETICADTRFQTFSALLGKSSL
jgi:ATP-dependent RNA helicase DDX20